MAADGIVEFPGQEAALELHARLRSGDDPTAQADLALAYLEPLARSLRAVDPRASDDERYTAAEDALLSLIARPESYDPGRMALDAYLRMAARRDLQNVQRSEWRHTEKRADWGAVELDEHPWEQIPDRDADPATIAETRETIEDRMRERLAISRRVVDGLSDGEIEALQLVRMGERRTEPFARALGLAHLPPEEQRARVKRVKDKLKVRMKRSGHD